MAAFLVGGVIGTTWRSVPRAPISAKGSHPRRRGVRYHVVIGDRTTASHCSQGQWQLRFKRRVVRLFPSAWRRLWVVLFICIAIIVVPILLFLFLFLFLFILFIPLRTHYKKYHSVFQVVLANLDHSGLHVVLRNLDHSGLQIELRNLDHSVLQVVLRNLDNSVLQVVLRKVANHKPTHNGLTVGRSLHLIAWHWMVLRKPIWIFERRSKSFERRY
jgi:hypothetical protein